MSDKKAPNVAARLIQLPNCYLWECVCPYCHELHTHGGGRPGGDPKSFLGHRVSHCDKDVEKIGYILEDNPDGVIKDLD